MKTKRPSRERPPHHLASPTSRGTPTHLTSFLKSSCQHLRHLLTFIQASTPIMDPLSPSHINPSWSNSPPTSTSSRALQSPSSSPFRQTTQLNSNSDSNSYFHPSSSTNTPIREPKVFGAPSMGLISPLPTASDASRPGAGAGTGTGEGSSSTGGGGVGGGRGERVGPYLRVKIGGLERNRKDLLVRFDASVSGWWAMS